MDMHDDASRDTTDRLLREATDKGIIDVGLLEGQLKNMRRRDILDSVHIWRNKSNGYYYAHYYDMDGKRKLIRRKIKSDLEDAIVEIIRSQQYAPTVKEMFTKWNNTRAENGFIELSTAGMNEDIFKAFLSDIADCRVNELTPESIATFLENLIATKDMRAKAFYNVKSIIKGTIKAARREGYVDFTPNDIEHELDVPERAFRKVKKKDEDEVFTDAEIILIMGYLKEHMDNIRNLAVLLLFISGLRIGECVALDWKNVHEDHLVVCATETRKKGDDGKWVFFVRDSTKTAAGERIVALPESFLWIWSQISKVTGSNKGFVFVDEEGVRINAVRLRAHFKRLCNKLNIPRRSPHKIRKTYCSILFESHVDPKIIEKMMGHVDITISERFYHRDRYETQQKVDIVSRIGVFNDVGQLDIIEDVSQSGTADGISQAGTADDVNQIEMTDDGSKSLTDDDDD